MVRGKKGSVKISELDSNNISNGLNESDDSSISDSSEESLSASLLFMHSCPHTVALRAFFCLFPSLSHSSVRILFSLPHFARPASRKTELPKNYLSAFGSLSALRNTRLFLEIRA